MPVFEAFVKGTSVAAPVFPLVLSYTFGLAVSILAYIAVAIDKEVRSIAMPQALLPLALIFVTAGEDVHAIALRLAILPLANV